jgi:hypothetical protein
MTSFRCTILFALTVMGAVPDTIFAQPHLKRVTEIPPTESAEIRVRLLNSNNGKPMGSQPIKVRFGRDLATCLPEQRTDDNGVADFHLEAPVSKWINVTEVSETIWHCEEIEKNTFITSDVLEHGIVALNKCDPKGKRTGKIAAQPGEVILFARPLRFWEQ